MLQPAHRMASGLEQLCAAVSNSDKMDMNSLVSFIAAPGIQPK